MRQQFDSRVHTRTATLRLQFKSRGLHRHIDLRGGIFVDLVWSLKRCSFMVKGVLQGKDYSLAAGSVRCQVHVERMIEDRSHNRSTEQPS